MKRCQSLRIISFACLCPFSLLVTSVETTKVKVRDFYTKKEINDFARSLENTQVEIRGYMAPPFTGRKSLLNTYEHLPFL